jgi:hypothetical protein
MRILATAHPNKDYLYYKCLQNVKLEARLICNQIEYWEIRPDPDNEKVLYEVKISESCVKDLFNTTYPMQDRCFLERENRDFYAVIHRNKHRFQHIFAKLKNPHLK